MQTIRVTKTITAPIDTVFDIYTDHAALAQVPLVRSARVTTPGIPAPNGLGAVREVDGGIVWLREEITAFERPYLMEYRIRESRPPTNHRLGRVEFAETPDGTEVTWTSVFGGRPSLRNRIVEPISRLAFGFIFRLTLRNVEQRARKAAARSRAPGAEQ